MSKKTPLAAYLVEQRRQRGWSQEHLAAVAGVGARTLQRLEARGTAEAETLRCVANALGLDVAVLLQLRECSQPDEGVLPGLTSARALAVLLARARGHALTHAPARSAQEDEVLRALCSDVADAHDLWPRLSPLEQERACEALQEHLERLEALGWGLFGSLQAVGEAQEAARGRAIARLHAAPLGSEEVRPERRVRQALQAARRRRPPTLRRVH